jgi:hypothetical protein
LCIIALDTLHVLHHSRRLPRVRISQLATFLDFQACTNALWDRKGLCESEYQAARARLETAGLERYIDEYLRRLGELEAHRPTVAGNDRHFHEVRAYREAVARLALASVTAIALHDVCLDEALRATHCDADVETLFRIAMQCQIVDDILDYREDAAAGLPSFMTATASLPRALRLTAEAARSYGARGECSSGAAVFPLRVALRVLTGAAMLAARIGRHRTFVHRASHAVTLSDISRDAQQRLKTRSVVNEDPASETRAYASSCSSSEGETIMSASRREIC